MVVAMSELCRNPICFWPLGLAFERKQMSQVIVNEQKWRKEIEGLELSGEHAKHGYCRELLEA